MADHILPNITSELAATRQALALDTEQAFSAFSKQVLEEGALSTKAKQLIAVAAAHITQCAGHPE